jgi:hypothetical protein
MKLKLALFMFALGLGGSFAQAAGFAYNGCFNNCYANYDYCMKTNSEQYCAMRQDICLQHCGVVLP